MRQFFITTALLLNIFINPSWAMEESEEIDKIGAYGGSTGHNLFKEKSKKAIQMVVSKANEHLCTMKSLEKPDRYHSEEDMADLRRGEESSWVPNIILNLGILRSKIANETKSEGYEKFGMCRSNDAESYTAMEDESYKWWRAKTASFLVEKLQPLIGSVETTTGWIQDKECSYRISLNPKRDKTDFDVLLHFMYLGLKQQHQESCADCSRKGKNNTHLVIELEMAVQPEASKTDQAIGSTKVFAMIGSDSSSPNPDALRQQCLNELKSKYFSDSSSPNNLSRQDCDELIRELIEKSDMISSVSSSVNNGLSQHDLDELIKNENQCKKTLLVTKHSESRNSDALLEFAQKYAMKAIGLDKDKIDPSKLPLKLKKYVAGAGYFIFHTMYHSRGSAAVTEWILQGLCAFHNYALDISETGWKAIDQRALCEPSRKTFVKEFKDKVILRSLSS